MAADSKTGSNPWWHPLEVAVGHHLDFRLGPLTLALGHGDDEWMLGLATTDESDEEEGRISRQKVKRGQSEVIDERFVHSGESGQVRFTPLLADRAAVFRPRQPVFLLGGQSITLYLSTPIWIRIEVADPPVMLKEFPVLRMSDTWFGPSTRIGELCYAGRTRARHSLDELPRRPHRAITPMTIHNRTAEPLPLEKVSLPVPMLSLYGAEDGSLWTQRVTLTREDLSDLASVKVDSALPEVKRELTRLAGPRVEGGRSGMTRAFSLLFGD